MDKDAASVAFQPRNTRPIRPLLERLVLGPAFKGADEDDAERIRRMAYLMALARPEALRDTKLFVGRPNPDELVNQLYDTMPHDSFITDVSGLRDVVAQHMGSMTETGLEQFPSSYFPVGDFAILPEASPGVAMHEVGHALDFNRPRTGGRLRRDLSWRYKPSELAEPLAWGRGARALGEGAAMTGSPQDEALAREVLMDAYTRRGPALGTYFGGTAGMLGGAGLGAYLGAKHLDWPLLGALLGVGIGGGAGTVGGAVLGRHLSRSRPRAERWADKMLSRGRSRRDAGKLPEHEETESREETEKAAAIAPGYFKTAKYRPIPESAGIPGPDHISFALAELDRLRSLVRPSDEILGRRGLQRGEFEDTVDELAARPGERYNLREMGDEMQRDAMFRSFGGGLAGGVGTGLAVNWLGGDRTTPMQSAAAGLGAGGILAGLEYLKYIRRRARLRNTAKVLKDYGLFEPTTLRRARPLITEG